MYIFSLSAFVWLAEEVDRDGQGRRVAKNEGEEVV